MSQLLVVDDEQSIGWGIRRLGERLGHRVQTAATAEDAMRQVEHFAPDLIVMDVRLPGIDGLTAMDLLREKIGPVPIIVISAFGDLETAVQAVRNGAREFLVKPFDLDQVERAVTRALAPHLPQPFPEPPVHAPAMLGRSAAMRAVFKDIALAAQSDVWVLLEGESGTGKELAARAIHQYSRRSAGPFVAVHVASLNPTLAESELFGHVRGAFTGADADRVGLLVQAHGGTLFLDEVAEVPSAIQVKLLRALELGEVLPVGSNTPIPTDFRVVSATHQDLTLGIQQGTFRHDLYFRLGAFRIVMPPLRQRPEDLQELADCFLKNAAKRSRTPATTLSPTALQDLLSRTWLGNVRELRNAMEHATVVSRGGIIQPEHLPPPYGWPAPQVASSPRDELVAAVRRWSAAVLEDASQEMPLYEQFLRVVEPGFLQVVLHHHQGHVAAAARHLGLHRTTLRKKLDDPPGNEGELQARSASE